MSAAALLRVEGLTRHFGGIAAVTDFDCELYPSEILGLIGPNGAGKSTTFNLLSGFLSAHAGKIWFEDRRIDGLKPAAIGRLGLVRTFQHNSLFRTLSVLDNVIVGATISTTTPRERLKLAKDTLEVFGLTGFADELAGSLPHGRQRLLSMAIAFATRPKLLCLDEPLTGLNQPETANVLAIIRQLRDQQSTSILFVEHNVRAVMDLCDRIVVLDQGRKLAEGIPADIRRDQAVIRAYLGDSE
jgi:branched-chain amino acid transport system ATP-binding protein